jgi:hypothetical protein
MSKIHELKINNFRGIKKFSEKFDKNFICLVGRGDSCKTTILEAISIVLSPNWNLSFYDSDFYNGNTDNAIEIEVSLIDLPDKLIREDKYGLHIRGLDSTGKIQDVIEEDHRKLLTIKLVVKKDLEPQWSVINNRHDPVRISANDRASLNVFTVADYIDRHFSWSRGNPLYAILKDNRKDSIDETDVILEALREAKEKIDQDSFKQFKDVTEIIKDVSSDFGIDLSGAKTTIDFRDVSIKDGRVCLHDGNVPLRLKGKGTKRLISIAIQTVLAQHGGIMLIDEIEQGLEPDRVKHLVRSLKKGNSQQKIITTHSSEVIAELEINDLLIVSGKEEYVTVTAPDNNFQGVIRSCPEAGFAKKVIVCEGNTEIGICRALDRERRNRGNDYMATKACVYVEGKGDNFTDRASRLKDLGLKVIVFCDADKDDKLTPSKDDLKNKDIGICDCDKGNSIEHQVFSDLPWIGVQQLLAYKEKELSETSIKDSIKSRYGRALPPDWKEADNDEIRKAIAKTANENEWFKRIDYGEILGIVIFKHLNMMDGKKIKNQMEALSNWIDN